MHLFALHRLILGPSETLCAKYRRVGNTFKVEFSRVELSFVQMDVGGEVHLDNLGLLLSLYSSVETFTPLHL